MSKSYKSARCEGTVSSVTDAVSALVELGEECREIVDNASEGLQQTQRIQTFDETAGELESIQEPDVPDVVAELRIVYTEDVPRRKGRAPSRAARCANAVAVVSAALDVVREWLDGLPDNDENKEDVETFASELEDIISSAENVEFPGMYG